MVLTEVSRSRGTRFVAALAAAILAVPITTANAADTVLWLNGTESVVPGPPPSGPPGGPISVLHGAYGTNVVTVKYPASFWPLTAAADPTGPVLGVSVDEGIANLHKAIGSTSGTVAVVGTSQGSLVVDDVQDDLDRTGAQPDADLTFVATADPQGATGLFTVFLPTGTHIPILEYTTRAAPVESAFDRVDITYQYDGVGNFPDRPWNLLADLNAILGGFYLHPLTQWADLSTVPESNITTTTNTPYQPTPNRPDVRIVCSPHCGTYRCGHCRPPNRILRSYTCGDLVRRTRGGGVGPATAGRCRRIRSGHRA